MVFELRAEHWVGDEWSTYEAPSLESAFHDFAWDNIGTADHIVILSKCGEEFLWRNPAWVVPIVDPGFRP